MKRIISVLLTLILCIGVLSGCANSTDGQVVANVGDEVITVGELKYAVELVKMQSVGQLSGDAVDEFWNTDKDGKDAESYIREKAMELLMNITVMAQAAKDNNLVVSASEVDDYFNENKESLQQTMETYGVSADVLKAILRKQMLYNKYGERVLSAQERFNPSEEELKELFANNFYKAQHILKMTVDSQTGAPLSQEAMDANKAAIDDLLKQAKSGADFKALMMEHSDDPGKEQSPDGYVFKEGDMVTEFYEGTVALGENEISDVIESGYGYHIIKRIPLDVDADFAANLSNVQYLHMEQEEKAVTEELKATMTITQDDAIIQAVPVKGA